VIQKQGLGCGSSGRVLAKTLSSNSYTTWSIMFKVAEKIFFLKEKKIQNQKNSQCMSFLSLHLLKIHDEIHTIRLHESGVYQQSLVINIKREDRSERRLS
jgi:hypothetical protein